MVNFNDLKNNLERAREHVEKAQSGEISRAQARFNKEKRKIEERHNKTRADIEEVYYESAAAILLHNLGKDYNLIQQRSEFLNIGQKEIAEANEMYKTIAGLSTEEDKRKVADLLKTRLDSKAVSALEFLLSNEPMASAEVSSYIATSSDKYQIELLVPIDGDANKSLAKSLEENTLNVLREGEIIPDSSITINQRGEPIRSNVHKIKFNADYQFSNGFITYKINPLKGENIQELTDLLTNKFRIIQPKDFEKANLSHAIMSIEPEVIEYFRSHGIEELRRIYEENLQEITSAFDRAKTTKSRDYGLIFESNNPQDRQQEALERLGTYADKETLTNKEIKYILGLKSTSAVSRTIGKKMKAIKKGRNLHVSPEQAREYILSHTPTKSSWTIK